MVEKPRRLELGFLPTPLQEAPRLARALGGPRVLLKRDDQTGLATGGNKARKLEYLLADAMDQKATAVVTVGGLQSNHCRMTAAACRRLGMEPYLLLNGTRPAVLEGNLLLDAIFGATLHFTPLEDAAAMDRELAGLAERARADGHRPWVIPLGGSNSLGALGYVDALRELLGQSAYPLDHVFVASGSGGTQAGLIAGTIGVSRPPLIHGVSVSRTLDMLVPRVSQLAAETAVRLGLTPPPADRVLVYDGYIGPGYAMMTEACRDAIRLVARTEGILLDPVYTGKAMAGLIDLIRAGRFARDETVVFWHTGGVPALQVYREWFADG
ncbi:MAG TPA: D-cysteine desulfhydrase family protein [Bacillota bacterium]|nr:D-cysteine desulfhydrase family protein [Bacillota bacterium]